MDGEDTHFVIVAITANRIAAPSSAGVAGKSKYRYDVCLSFRGEDTSHSYTVHLHDALCRKGINAFIDDEKLGKGERISPTLLKAIEKSRISIIVFSKNYATSTWCLDELVRIIQCKKEKNQLVMPLFYNVDPMDVQNQRNSFGDAMAALEDRLRDDWKKVRKWRSALSEAASLSSAWLLEDGYGCGFIEKIVEDVYAMLPPKCLHCREYMVGLEPRIEMMKSLLDHSNDGICMLGIYGTGGIEKTTLADRLCGIVHLWQTLLTEILEEKNTRFGSVDKGISRIKHRLSHKSSIGS
ncbi:TMV resistance protein N-like [Neltuma alba]|uniref:TMV resistance protein N-like n=1 Tax=Neltuma alba TaxID=207710 RepID=UPI0010A46F25|nr:TMV resistance protein N-like [Prosopis alba]